MEYKLQIGQILRYPKIAEDSAEYIDDCLNFKHLAKFKNAASFQLERGINTPAPIKGSDKIMRRPALLVASSPHKKGSEETPWQDFFDTDNGHIRYFGDNKINGNDPAKAPGNKALLEAFRLAHSHDPKERALTPPVLFFKRVTHKGKSKGFPQFQGFGVIRSVELVTQWNNKLGFSFTNYAFDFTVFNLESENDEFEWEWINCRRNRAKSLAATTALAPKSWRTWISQGANSLDRVRRRVSRLQVVAPAKQKPIQNSETHNALLEIYNYFDTKKHHFEALAEIIAERVIGRGLGIYERGWVTVGGGDGGVDFVAKLNLANGFSKTHLIVLGQAKCESLDSPTSGNHIARTVARLKRGWVGVYVTTSYFSAKVQQEVVEDRYPIVLINGRRVAEEVLKIVHESDEHVSIKEYLDKISNEFQTRIRQRNPEEILTR